MLRTTFLLIPALAFAMPFATAEARPLTSVDQPVMWDGDDHDNDDGDDNDIEINFCLELQVEIDNGACFGEGRPTCIDSCSQAAEEACGQQVGTRAFESCTARLTRSCHRSCTNTVAALCQPRWDGDDHDDNDDHDDSDVFIEIEFCFELEIDN